jgi:hypothetical protein
MNAKEFIVPDDDLGEMYRLPEFQQLVKLDGKQEITLYSMHKSNFFHLNLDRALQKYNLAYLRMADELAIHNDKRSEETDIIDSLLLAKNTGLPLITINDRIIRVRSRLAEMGIALLTPEEAVANAI